MSADQLKKVGIGINTILDFAMKCAVAFCTFVLSQMWAGWKEHQEQDELTAKTVIRHDETLKAHTQYINYLTGRIDGANQNKQ